MATAAKRLNIGDVVEIDGRRYDVVPDKRGGVTLEPAITVFAAELHRMDGTLPISEERYTELFGDIPGDDEG